MLNYILISFVNLLPDLWHANILVKMFIFECLFCEAGNKIAFNITNSVIFYSLYFIKHSYHCFCYITMTPFSYKC